MLVVAGPSGSGKSTFFHVADAGGAAFNIDDRCAELNGGSYSNIPPEIRARAQQECQGFIEACTRDLRSFAVETTLRTDIAIRQAVRARSAGFRITMVFVATDDVEENVLRVTRRGLDGGHSAPAPQIREIYRLSLANLPDAIRTFDEVILYDCTAFVQPPRVVARFIGGGLVARSPSLPRWCTIGDLRALIGE
jgi:predicted ABC-type ATPase